MAHAGAMLGAWPITLDPIFSGLAWALIFGLFVTRRGRGGRGLRRRRLVLSGP